MLWKVDRTEPLIDRKCDDGHDCCGCRCGPMSEACQAHFVNEACLYECDVHVGKWRRYDTCVDDSDSSNGWQVL